MRWISLTTHFHLFFPCYKFRRLVVPIIAGDSDQMELHWAIARRPGPFLATWHEMKLDWIINLRNESYTQEFSFSFVLFQHVVAAAPPSGQTEGFSYNLLAIKSWNVSCPVLPILLTNQLYSRRLIQWQIRPVGSNSSPHSLSLLREHINALWVHQGITPSTASDKLKVVRDSLKQWRAICCLIKVQWMKSE